MKDHLPSLLPREASGKFREDGSWGGGTLMRSDAFSKALLPSLLLLDRRDDPREAQVWTQAKELFEKKVAELPKQ